MKAPKIHTEFIRAQAGFDLATGSHTQEVGYDQIAVETRIRFEPPLTTVLMRRTIVSKIDGLDRFVEMTRLFGVSEVETFEVVFGCSLETEIHQTTLAVDHVLQFETPLEAGEHHFFETRRTISEMDPLVIMCPRTESLGSAIVAFEDCSSGIETVLILDGLRQVYVDSALTLKELKNLGALEANLSRSGVVQHSFDKLEVGKSYGIAWGDRRN